MPSAAAFELYQCKGFDQKGVSEIIARTDPRRQAELIGA